MIKDLYSCYSEFEFILQKYFCSYSFLCLHDLSNFIHITRNISLCIFLCIDNHNRIAYVSMYSMSLHVSGVIAY